jgi:hypothetical protein
MIYVVTSDMERTWKGSDEDTKEISHVYFPRHYPTRCTNNYITFFNYCIIAYSKLKRFLWIETGSMKQRRLGLRNN